MNNTFQDVEGLDSMGASPDGLGLSGNSSLGFINLGDDGAQQQNVAGSGFKRTLAIAYGIASIAGAGIGAYHGYKRNDSVGWAIGWSILGSLFPVIVIPVAMAQGIGKRAGR